MNTDIRIFQNVDLGTSVVPSEADAAQKMLRIEFERRTGLKIVYGYFSLSNLGLGFFGGKKRR